MLRLRRRLSPKALLSDYSWDELSQISARIATAATDDEGLAIAQEYKPGRCRRGARPTRRVRVVLDDNTLAANARIVWGSGTTSVPTALALRARQHGVALSRQPMGNL